MADPDRGVRLSFPSHPRYLTAVREMMMEFTALAGLSDSDREEVVLAVQEGLSNVIRHCYQNHYDNQVDLEVKLLPDGLEIRIDDYGKFTDPSAIAEKEAKEVRPGGMGVRLMKRAMDVVQYRPNRWGGTTLILKKRKFPRRGG